jgi:GntR family transcriptional regulator
VEQPLSGLTSFTEDMHSRGLDPQTKIMDFKELPCIKNIAKKLKIEEGEFIYEVSRLRLADNIPMALEISYLPAKLVKNLNEKIVNASLYNYIEDNLKLKISHATQTIESSLCQNHESSILGVSDGDPVLLIERYSYIENGTPFEYVKSIYRGDRYKFVIDLKR